MSDCRLFYGLKAPQGVGHQEKQNERKRQDEYLIKERNGREKENISVDESNDQGDYSC